MQLYYPKLKRPNTGPFKTCQSFHSFASSQVLMAYKPFFVDADDYDPAQPRRKNMVAPIDKGTFVKPIKQSFVKNPRTMPMTRIMLTLLAGWAGQGGSIKTTTGVIGKHLGRCRRQVFRYLKDAVEEGYITYTRTKDKMGYYTGIRIWLNYAAIRFTTSRKAKNTSKNAETSDVTLKSDSNDKYIFTVKEDPELSTLLGRFGSLIENETEYIHV